LTRARLDFLQVVAAYNQAQFALRRALGTDTGPHRPSAARITRDDASRRSGEYGVWGQLLAALTEASVSIEH
jgi:hypothetical protein